MKWNWQKEGLFQILNPWMGTLPESQRIFGFRKILTDIERMRRRIKRQENCLKFKKKNRRLDIFREERWALKNQWIL